eukprot:1142734-Pelagomonas_calceolata.AAC.3
MQIIRYRRTSEHLWGEHTQMPLSPVGASHTCCMPHTPAACLHSGHKSMNVMQFAQPSFQSHTIRSQQQVNTAAALQQMDCYI